MSRAWFVLWAIVIWQIAIRTFAPEPSTQPASFTPISGQEFVDHEKYIEDARGTARKTALVALDRPWSERCGPRHKQFVSELNDYYYQRQNQSERYPEIYGPAGADYIAKQWKTPEDRRAERLTQEAYTSGYLKPADFDGVASRMIATIVQSERVTGRGCAS